MDWNSYRSAIENTASGVLGRKVSILGDIGIELLPEPHLRANNVAAGGGRSGGLLMTASAVDVSVSLGALFGGRLDAGRLKLVQPVLTLDFSKPFAEPEAAADAASSFAADVRNIEIEDGRISVFSSERREQRGTCADRDKRHRFGRLSWHGLPLCGARLQGWPLL